MSLEQELLTILNQIPAAIEKAFMAWVEKHPGHANQKTHGNRFGAGQAKESLRRLKDDKGAREKYKARARQKLGKEAKPERAPGKMNPKVKPKPKRTTKKQAAPNDKVAKVKDALGDKLHVSDPNSAYTKQALEDLSLVPQGTLIAMKYKGVGVHIGDKPLTELDSNGPLKGVQPRGWPEGSTWDKVGGVYNPGCKCLTAAGKGQSGSVSTVLHELGHAIHSTNGLTSSQQERLTSIHKKVFKKLPNYLQQGGPGGKAGIEEMWAEGFAHVIKDPKTAKGFYSQEFIDLVKEVV